MIGNIYGATFQRAQEKLNEVYNELYSSICVLNNNIARDYQELYLENGDIWIACTAEWAHGLRANKIYVDTTIPEYNRLCANAWEPFDGYVFYN